MARRLRARGFAVEDTSKPAPEPPKAAAPPPPLVTRRPAVRARAVTAQRFPVAPPAVTNGPRELTDDELEELTKPER